jgi:hypothetical protein
VTARLYEGAPPLLPLWISFVEEAGTREDLAAFIKTIENQISVDQQRDCPAPESAEDATVTQEPECVSKVIVRLVVDRD